MAKSWYPVIDYIVCKECGICIKKCPHSVFDAEKSPTPVVSHPEACVDRCHNCGNQCPVGAVTYVGDDTGWMPPKGTRTADKACCSCKNKCC